MPIKIVIEGHAFHSYALAADTIERLNCAACGHAAGKEPRVCEGCGRIVCSECSNKETKPWAA